MAGLENCHEGDRQQVEHVSISPEVLQLVSMDFIDWAIEYTRPRCNSRVDVHFMDNQGVAVCFVMGKVSVLTIPQARMLIETIKSANANSRNNRVDQTVSDSGS